MSRHPEGLVGAYTMAEDYALPVCGGSARGVGFLRGEHPPVDGDLGTPGLRPQLSEGCGPMQ